VISLLQFTCPLVGLRCVASCALRPVRSGWVPAGKEEWHSPRERAPHKHALPATTAQAASAAQAQASATMPRRGVSPPRQQRKAATSAGGGERKDPSKQEQDLVAATTQKKPFAKLESHKIVATPAAAYYSL
jgi:hypothetical protein